MKIKHKGKVYPAIPTSSSSTDDVLSILNILPAAILALASVLSLQDREVLAYMITRSLKTSTATTFVCSKQSTASAKDNSNSKKKVSNSIGVSPHKTPSFNCDCFDCYTTYWFKWDSSSNRELIHQVIEAFEEHLSNGEFSKKGNGKSKKRDKIGRKLTEKPMLDVQTEPLIKEIDTGGDAESAPIASVSGSAGDSNGSDEVAAVAEVMEETTAVVVKSPPPVTAGHKGLARKVLPDVLGLFNSRLWHLWSPNV